MCGRLIANLSASTAADLLGATRFEGTIEPRFNLAPGGIAPMVCVDKRPGMKGTNRVVIPAAFAIPTPEPAWKAIKKGRPAYDTYTVEVPSVKSSALKKAPWANLLRHRRGIVAVSGYYDWIVPFQNLPKHKHAHAVMRKDGAPMLLACLYDETCEQRQGADVRFALVTVATTDDEAAPNGWTPAILNAAEIAAWLGDDGAAYDYKRLIALMHPPLGDSLRRYRVSDAVGDCGAQWRLFDSAISAGFVRVSLSGPRGQASH